MPTIFSKIIAGELPCHKIAEDDKFLAFLDLRPVNPGHTLVIPKQEVNYLFDLPEDLLSEIMPFARPVAKAIEQAVPCLRIGVMVAGLEVPHAHVHLIPILKGLDELSFSRAKDSTADELSSLCSKIVSCYQNQG